MCISKLNTNYELQFRCAKQWKVVTYSSWKIREFSLAV
jgi:hypothetical protein